jgi:hypothetical protein
MTIPIFGMTEWLVLGFISGLGETFQQTGFTIYREKNSPAEMWLGYLRTPSNEPITVHIQIVTD